MIKIWVKVQPLLPITSTGFLGDKNGRADWLLRTHQILSDTTMVSPANPKCVHPPQVGKLGN